MLHNIWHYISSLAIFALLLRQGLARIPADQFEVPVPQQALNPVQVGDDAEPVCCFKSGFDHPGSFNAGHRFNVRTPKDDPQRPIQEPDSYNKSLLPLAFEPLPLGSVKPLGWLGQQMRLMADGLPGHMHEFYRLIKDAPWLGGHQEYSWLNEAWPYSYNALVPLAYVTDDPRLKSHVLRVTNYILDHQHADGWLGPEEQLSRRNFWGRYPLFLGLIQLIEVEPELAKTRILPAMHRFIDLMHEMLSHNYQGFVWRPGDEFDEQWGRSRAADMVFALQWLYEKHPDGNQRKIHHCMVHLYEMAYDWGYWFDEKNFLKVDLDLLPVQLTNSLFPYVHGVNAGQGLKWGAVMRRIAHDDSLLDVARNGVNWTFTYHGTPSGAIVGDEREAGLSPVRGTELCSVVESMFSLNYLYQALGDRDFADRVELAAYNALPVMLMPDWWAHQYIAQTNQPVSRRLEQSPFWNVGPFGQTFGTEPNFPCCTVNMQGYSKFVPAMYLKDGDEGLVHAVLGPAQVSTTLKGENPVVIQCETKYPFINVLNYEIKARYPFKFSFRVPSWVVLSESGVWIDGGAKHHLKPNEATGLHTMVVPAGLTHIEVKFGAEIRIEPRANDTVAVYHGALLYAVSPAGDYYYTRPGRYPDSQAPPEARDWEIVPWSSWNLAIDTTTLKLFEYPPRDLPNPIWRYQAPPVSISVLACEIDWKLTGGYAPNPPLMGQRNCTSRAFPIELRPYGSAKLHMAELPTVDLRPGSPDLWRPKDGNGNENNAEWDYQLEL
ncbi:hypothetical protein PV10_04731 [Exophiala mesophila]|uniref:Uncharacterized protein n=1 Tax=Exophiala mesophila TaxID=212818 RepID=A0A0D1XZ85_EXOME|nr:uncharacterized protein PV10_04731 [Exophiala mesophila]KIV93521.1 hypothetical protein PV10_04731 [Exophiala mesophila]